MKTQQMNKKKRYKLSEHSYKELDEKKLPVDILTELKEFRDQEFMTRREFVIAIEQEIGKDRIKQYKQLILQHAEIAEQAEKSVVREYTEAFVIAIILAIIIRMFVVEAFKIPSGSMIPTLEIGDHLLVNKFIYKFAKPKRRDVIVFKYPDNPSRNFIKRIIGVGGDKIEIRDKVVYVNNESQDEPFIKYSQTEIFTAKDSRRDNFGPIIVPPHSYFMMGDNRDSSLDSRFWENRFVNERAIVGKAFIIYWSWKNDENMALSQHEAVADKVIRWLKTTVYNITHLPFVVRWNRLGKIIR